MNRARDYYRKQRKRVIRNKSHLLKRLDSDDLYVGWARGCPGRLTKGKIYCSCWMCRTKSYDNLSHADLKREIDTVQQFLGIGICKQLKEKY